MIRMIEHRLNPNYRPSPVPCSPPPTIRMNRSIRFSLRSADRFRLLFLSSFPRWWRAFLRRIGIDENLLSVPLEVDLIVTCLHSNRCSIDQFRHGSEYRRTELVQWRKLIAGCDEFRLTFDDSSLHHGPVGIRIHVRKSQDLHNGLRKTGGIAITMTPRKLPFHFTHCQKLRRKILLANEWKIPCTRSCSLLAASSELSLVNIGTNVSPGRSFLDRKRAKRFRVLVPLDATQSLPICRFKLSPPFWWSLRCTSIMATTKKNRRKR